MAGTGVWNRLLERHRARLTKDPDMNKVVTKLIKRRFFSDIEERQLAGASDASERTDLLLDKLSRDTDAFREFCMTLEECAPHLLTELLLDRGEIFRTEGGESEDTQALQLGFELALKERDAALREQAQTRDDLAQAHRHLDALKAERDQVLRSLDSLSASRSPSLKGKSSVSSLHRPQDSDDPLLVEENGDNVVWQIHKVTLKRVANYGFGIAVSGGYDSPHFASGDPSIAISDVLKAGPAEGQLQLNDRIISVNGVSLENVSHSVAIQVLKNSGDSVNLVIRRRVVMPAAVEKESPPLRVTLVKKNKKDEFGVVFGCRFYIQDVLPDSLASQDGGLRIGDNILKVNNTPLEGLSVGEVRKLMERSKDRLQLIVSKASQADDRVRSSNSYLRDDEGYATFRPPHDKDDINLYRPSDPPPGMYHPPAGPTPFDSRYTYEQEAPPRPALPSTLHQSLHINEGPHSPTRERVENFYSLPPRREPGGYYSDHDRDGFRGPPDEEMFARSPPHDDMDLRRVVFQKDKQKGLGLRLAGGNATGIFIASVQPGTGAHQQGLVEGDQILQANGLDIVGLTREEAVAHLTSLEGQVTLVVQYRKEDYDSIMASHEAGDSFYVRTHFNYQPNSGGAGGDAGAGGDHSFKVGDIFHIKDTLFRGVGGSWLAIRVSPNGEELKKGTIPNRKKAEALATAQQESSTGGPDTLPTKGRGGLFKRKSTRRAKSLGKDHWEEVIFSGLSTKFPPYERVVLRDPAFIRPVVLFGAIADVARDMLIREFPDRFESLQAEKGADNDPKKAKTGIIRFGAIRESIDRKKHCVLDVTPYHVDQLNYAQYYPIVVFLKADSKQAIKEVRGRWRAAPNNTAKNPKKLAEHNENMESLCSQLFTGVIKHTTTDVWFPQLVEMITAQQRRPVWMSEKKPEEDFNDDFMFPMPNRLSIAHTPEHELDLARPADDLDISPMQKKRLVRSSSDPSVNTADRVPGIPPYPAPPGYGQDRKLLSYDKGRERWDNFRQPTFPLDREGDWQVHPDDRYFPHPHHLPPKSWSPHHPTSSQPPVPGPHHPYMGGVGSRSSVDFYATVSTADHARRNDYPSHHEEYSQRGDAFQRSGPRPSHDPHPSTSMHPGDHRVYNDESSNDNDSYSRYVSSPANKHDDSKLRDKFSSLQVRSDRNPGSHDPYRFTRSTANPVSSANIDRVKLSHLTARYKQEDRQGKGVPSKAGGTTTSPTSPTSPSSTSTSDAMKKKEPPPVPVKTYSLKEVGMDPEEIKARNYENSNRSYNYSEVHFPGQQEPPLGGGSDARYPHDTSLPHPPPPGSSDSPYEYISTRNTTHSSRRGETVPPEISPPLHDDYYKGGSNSRAFSNSVYMDQREVERVRLGGERVDVDPGGYMRPRTDDEQLRDLQVQRQHRSHLRSKPPLLADRAKSETRLENQQRSPAPAPLSSTALSSPSSSRWNKYRSWDSEKGQRTFDSYKKLITPGFYGSRKVMSKSHDELREETGPDKPLREYRAVGAPSQSGSGGSAFESYRKGSSSSSVPPTRQSRPAEDILLAGEDEDGQTVVATARGIFTSAGGVLKSEETGVNIVIPEGALEEGMSQEIYFKVCSGNSILPPLDEDKGETLLSPLVMCGPHGLRFKKPVQLHLPHSASVNPHNWSFALKSSDSPSGQPTQWQNMTLAGSEGIAHGQVSQNSVSVLVDHF